MKKIFLTVSILFVTCLSGLNISALIENAFPVCFYDNTGVVDNDTANTINNLLSQYSNKIGTPVMLIIDMPVDNPDFALNEFFNKHISTDPETSGIVLRIQYDPNHADFLVGGKLEYLSSGDKILTDSLMSKCKDRDYEGIARTYIMNIRNTDKTNTGKSDYSYQSSQSSQSSGIDTSYIITSFVIGIAVGGITFLCIKLAYRFKNKISGSNYIDNPHSHITSSSDTFLRQYTTKTKIESDSNGGGSHSGGGGGGRSGGGRSF